MENNNSCFTPSSFADQAEELLKSIESNEKGNNRYGINYSEGDRRALAYAAIRGLMPDYKGDGNPLADKRFVALMETKYGQTKPDPFTAFLEAAQRNLPPEYQYIEERNSRDWHPLQEENSQYTKNRKKNEALADENVIGAKPLSEKLLEIARDLYDSGAEHGFRTLDVPGGFLTSTAGIPQYLSGQIAGIVEDFQGKNPSLVKLATEITQKKDRLIKEMPDESMLIGMVHEELLHNIEDNRMNRRANKAESKLRDFEGKRVEEEGVEPEYTESDFNRELARNSINIIKEDLNKYVVHSVHGKIINY